MTAPSVRDACRKPSGALGRHDGHSRDAEHAQVCRQMEQGRQIAELAKPRDLGFTDQRQRLFMGDLLRHLG